MLVGIEEVLVRLRDKGPQPTSAIAHDFGLNPLDARILLLDAHLHGLVVRNDWGEWAISARGRDALTTVVDEQLASHRRVHANGRPAQQSGAQSWRRGPRRAVLVSAAAAVCGVLVGVAIGLANSSGGPAQAPGNQEAQAFAGRHERAFVVGGVHGTHGLTRAEERLEPALVRERELRLDSRGRLGHSTPFAILEARVVRGGARGAASATTVRVASVRRVSGKGCSTASTSRSSARHTGTRQHPTASRCSTSSRASHPAANK